MNAAVSIATNLAASLMLAAAAFLAVRTIIRARNARRLDAFERDLADIADWNAKNAPPGFGVTPR